ncbi:MAG: TM0106 family RecB-like putative nuclease, partial [Nostoc indistinguendum CM1-VF10]|nr:TM0106 family RecB-like putative nuclease [Nostoc indistinguendum CM1-VF10]
MPNWDAPAIRDNKIYVAKSPEISLSNNLIFLDVEGIPDQEFYYLIGLIIIKDNIISSFSFWADEGSDEEGIWKAFLEILINYDELTLLHYGKYEINFLERMKKKYGGDDILFEKIISSSINVLSLIYANIYFPTYSNSLKDIGFYLGYKWSEKGANGLKSIVWRYEWENTRNDFVKQQIITYNLEDCLATKCVAEAIVNISGLGELDMTFIEDIKTEKTSKFEKTKYIFKELEIVNKCAYFDYQREKIFFRNDKRRAASRLKKKKITPEKYPINKSIEIATPESCYECSSSRLGKINQASKTLVNLKFF